ncbi:hypothetical protein [Encephalitozoon cuniculi GB-M1]|uniref:Uncharacterized protein n=2 Tax=Encephalitozoon cuniculi TaxID=6035 RepID=Q8SUV7_ENCCU|nr:uncharacterized protein ECU07_1580 [Encephalitozoon cuniculi GB-M1]AGE95812.1 hypothetical protein ECU07_1580 [Encephalitozoon cuniculi]UYI27319.1 hypothetical protein J0A71_05g11820 [Encephalitozoon cuniculi]CAD25689.1 hypothetical protein [Encephalitozoon cuniculi GB-M1]
MDILRNEVKKVEDCSLSMKEALGRCQDVAGFIGLYLRRNPSRRHPEFLEFYDDLDVSSQVLLYEHKRKMVKNDRFELECITRYCIEQRSELSYDIIRTISNPKILFKALAASFSSVDLDEEDDFFFTRCIVLALRTHSIDSDEMDTLIAGVGCHFSDGRRVYYEHGAIVASVLLNTCEFGVESMDEAQRMIGDIPPCVLKKDRKHAFVDPSNAFSRYKRVENDLGIVRSSWRPRYLQEAIKIIAEEKDIEKIEISFKCFPDLVGSATERTLKHRGKEALEVLVGYDGFEEHKVDAISSLLRKSFGFLAGDAVDDFFNTRLCLKHRIILIFSFRKVIKEVSCDQAIFLYRSIRFMHKRVHYEIPRVMARALECFLSEGQKRAVEVRGSACLESDLYGKEGYPWKCMKLN